MNLISFRCILPVLVSILTTLAVAGGATAVAHGEWVILTSGEKFQTDKSWSEGDRLKFRLNGLVVSVPQSDVSKVIKPGAENGMAAPVVAQKKRQPTASRPKLEAVSVNNRSGKRKERLQNALRLPPPKSGGASKAQNPIRPEVVRQPQKATDRVIKSKGDAAAAAPGLGPARSVFRDLAWGMRPSSMPGLLLSQTVPAYGGVDEFFYPEEELLLGEAPLNGIVYGFWQNRLYTITIWTDGRPSYEKLRQWVIEVYGPGHQRKKEVERRVWYGDGSDRLLEFDETLNTGILWMRSEKLHARIKQIAAH